LGRREVQEQVAFVKITVAHSPDSDDAFMFYGLASGKVPTDGIEVDHLLCDIETLNQRAFDGTYEVSAVSFNAYAHLTDRYLLLPHGSSMGDRYGPIVVARADGPSSTSGVTVAVAGTLTTSYLALKLYDPDVETVVMPFDRIQDAVRDGEVAAGLLIHEGQLTYEAAGLHKVLDLGEWWLLETGLPLPLGVNLVRRDVGDRLHDLSAVLLESIQAGLANRREAMRYAMRFGRGIDAATNERFVDMYVNERTCDYGDEGRAAVAELLRRGDAIGAFPEPVRLDYVS
jgi:1,4-dihydroxy-6-naphthoate synthase